MPRIYDPNGTIPIAVRDRCISKIEQALTILGASQRNNGNPLLQSYAIGRRFILDDTIPGFTTAATDGKRFYFYPGFIEQCTTLQVVILLKHECWHNLLSHAETMGRCEMPKVFNIAADFIVNSLVELDWENSSFGKHAQNDKTKSFWSEPFGEPITLENLKILIKEQGEQLVKDNREAIDDYKKRKENADDYKFSENNNSKKCSCEPPKEPKVKYTFVDKSLLKRSAIDVYKEIKEWYKGINGDLQALVDMFLTDNHFKDDREKGEALAEVFKALNFAKSGRGTVPDEVEFFLKELTEPTLDLSGYIDQTIQKIKMNSGNIATYTHFKRRFIGNELFYPRYIRHHAQILVLLDTSGSMSDSDIAAGVTELKQFIGKSNMYIVPVDATPHWDSVTKVTRTTDFQTVKLVGRGGTVFQEFFANYRTKLKKYGHFSSIVVITDGYIDIIPPELKPNCGVAWVMTSPSSFNQHFGQAIYLKRPT